MHFHKNEEKIILVINKEEKLVESLTNFAIDNNLTSGCITGIGALKDAELGYYQLEHKSYIKRKFINEDFELLSLIGNITIKEGKPYVHVHVVLGRDDFSCIGGHLFEGTVAVTAEINIINPDLNISRKMNDAIGLQLICE